MGDDYNIGPPVHDEAVGDELALKVHRAELPRRLDRDAVRLLSECATRVEYERRLDDLVDHILERAPMTSEPGLFRGLVITGAAYGEIEITVEDGVEVSPEQIEKAAAAHKWEQKADLRRSVEQDVGPSLEVRKRWWLRRFDEQAEKPRGSVEAPRQPQLASDPKRKRGRPPFPMATKVRALAKLKATGSNKEAAKVLYGTQRPTPSNCRSVSTILGRIDPERKPANRE